MMTKLTTHVSTDDVMNTTPNSMTGKVKAATTEVGTMTNLAGLVGNRE